LNTIGNDTNWHYKFKNVFFSNIFINISNELLISARESGGVVSSPNRVWGGAPEAKAFLVSISPQILEKRYKYCLVDQFGIKLLLAIIDS